jgi:hypothetical protein
MEGRLLSWRHHWVDATSHWLSNRVHARLPQQARRRTMSCSGRGRPGWSLAAELRVPTELRRRGTVATQGAPRLRQRFLPTVP